MHRDGLCLTEQRLAALAFSSVRCWLQAITFMPKARPIRATSFPMLPNPTTASVLPLRLVPSPVCQPPP
jgi:hypothetical protein